MGAASRHPGAMGGRVVWMGAPEGSLLPASQADIGGGVHSHPFGGDGGRLHAARHNLTAAVLAILGFQQ